MIPFHYTSLRNPKGKGYNHTFLYPNTGLGSQELVNQLAQKLEIYLEHRLISLDTYDKIARVQNQQEILTIRYDRLIFTGSVANLQKTICETVPELQKVLFHSVKMFVINVALSNLADKFKSTSWLYLPDSEIPFFRIGFYNRVQPSTNGKEILYIEFSYSGNYDQSSINKEFIETYLKRIGILEKSDSVLLYDIIPIGDAYPIIKDQEFESKFELLKQSLEKQDVYLTGRYALWKWSGMLETMIDAHELATKLG